MKNILIILAPGFEEIEAITVIDILRRAGFHVTVAGTQPGPIVASRQTKHLPDVLLDEVRAEQFDAVVLPGGQPGTTHLRNDPRVRQLLEQFHARQRPIAAICAAPTVLASLGLLKDRAATSHPTASDEVARAAAQYRDDRVVVDGPIITSRAAGTAMEFAFELVRQWAGEEKVSEVNRSVLARL